MFGMSLMTAKKYECGWALVLACGLVACAASKADNRVWRFDCGTPKSPVMQGYQRLSAGESYSATRGYGWQGGSTRHLEFKRPVRNPKLRGSFGQLLLEEAYDNHRNPLNRDGVVSRQDLGFRLDLPNGTYRVAVTMGSLFQTIGSIDLSMNDRLVAEQLAVWAPGGYRMLDITPAGWWTTFRATVEVTDGALQIDWKKNQQHYDAQMAEQATLETPYAKWYHSTPIIQKPPYDYIGYPFVGHSVMAIEITPHRPGPVSIVDGKLRLNTKIASPRLRTSIERYNAGRFEATEAALREVREPGAQVAKAVIALWLSGRLETEIEQELVPQALPVLRAYVKANPDAHGVAELLSDAEIFQRAMHIHVNRGGAEAESNHFVENDKAIGWWWMIQPDSPLRDKARLHLARAAHMLKPYFPVLGTEKQVFLELAEKCPDNRFVKYHLHQQWEPHGDGSDYYDWTMVDYASKANGAPEWVRAIYPAFGGLVDLSEWWIRFRQSPQGDIGGGWSDDVELVGLFGYYGYVGRGVSDLCIQGTGKLINGVWNLSEVDPEIGYSLPMADAEHTAEPTGNTLGMMMQLDYGNPIWIERCMKTGKLIRDLWTDYDDQGHRRFRANFMGATQVGTGDRMNDSWINYRAVSPATAVLNYNGNPTIAKLYTEIADSWVAAAMSTERGKPKGVIPAQISFPDRTLGGTRSPNWYTASHPPGTVNYDWSPQKYKAYVLSILFSAYQVTGDARYLEPMRLEYELAIKHGHTPEPAGPLKRSRRRGPVKVKAPAGSEKWIAAQLAQTEKWIEAKRMLDGRSGPLKDLWSKDQIIASGNHAAEHLKTNWPVSTSEAGPTDRVGFVGIIDPFFIYTGGSWGGPLLKAAVTYENTTKDFAAAVVASDPQGLRIHYYSLAPQRRKIGIVPWELEAGGTYKLVYGVDADDDGKIDTVTEQREFVFSQHGTPIQIDVKPGTNYVVEIDQLKRGRSMGPAPDPGLCAEDIRYHPERNLLTARIHNVGSVPIRNVKVAFYEGNPAAGGKRITLQRIPNIEAPNDLEPRTVTVGVNRHLDQQTEIYVVIDPDHEISREITTFNNAAHRTLPAAEQAQEPPKAKKAMTRSNSRRRR
ncbi:MAG: hypothetical protein ACYSWQ_05905 [Planctomycetota bacterium]|jgi:hypothetical protein